MRHNTESRTTLISASFLALVLIGAAAGNAVAAERTVIGEYFNATW